MLFVFGFVLAMGTAWLNGWGLEAFLIIWFVTDLGGDLFLWFLAWRELRRHDLLEGIRPTLRPAACPAPGASPSRSI